MAYLNSHRMVIPYRYSGASPALAPTSRSTSVTSLPPSYSKKKAAYEERDQLRSVDNLKYGSTFLSADRVEQVFDFSIHANWYYGEVDECATGESPRPNPDLVKEDYEYQLSLPMENVDEVEAKLVHQIQKYRRATEHMAVCALAWWDLMEDLRQNPHLEEEFNRFQLLRKLSGGTC